MINNLRSRRLLTFKVIYLFSLSFYKYILYIIAYIFLHFLVYNIGCINPNPFRGLFKDSVPLCIKLDEC